MISPNVDTFIELIEPEKALSVFDKTKRFSVGEKRLTAVEVDSMYDIHISLKKKHHEEADEHRSSLLDNQYQRTPTAYTKKPIKRVTIVEPLPKHKKSISSPTRAPIGRTNKSQVTIDELQYHLPRKRSRSLSTGLTFNIVEKKSNRKRSHNHQMTDEMINVFKKTNNILDCSIRLKKVDVEKIKWQLKSKATDINSTKPCSVTLYRMEPPRQAIRRKSSDFQTEVIPPKKNKCEGILEELKAGIEHKCQADATLPDHQSVIQKRLSVRIIKLSEDFIKLATVPEVYPKDVSINLESVQISAESDGAIVAASATVSAESEGGIVTANATIVSDIQVSTVITHDTNDEQLLNSEELSKPASECNETSNYSKTTSDDNILSTSLSSETNAEELPSSNSLNADASDLRKLSKLENIIKNKQNHLFDENQPLLRRMVNEQLSGSKSKSYVNGAFQVKTVEHSNTISDNCASAQTEFGVTLDPRNPTDNIIESLNSDEISEYLDYLEPIGQQSEPINVPTNTAISNQATINAALNNLTEDLAERLQCASERNALHNEQILSERSSTPDENLTDIAAPNSSSPLPREKGSIAASHSAKRQRTSRKRQLCETKADLFKEISKQLEDDQKELDPKYASYIRPYNDRVPSLSVHSDTKRQFDRICLQFCPVTEIINVCELVLPNDREIKIKDDNYVPKKPFRRRWSAYQPPEQWDVFTLVWCNNLEFSNWLPKFTVSKEDLNDLPKSWTEDVVLTKNQQKLFFQMDTPIDVKFLLEKKLFKINEPKCSADPPNRRLSFDTSFFREIGTNYVSFSHCKFAQDGASPASLREETVSNVGTCNNGSDGSSESSDVDSNPTLSPPQVSVSLSPSQVSLTPSMPSPAIIEIDNSTVARHSEEILDDDIESPAYEVLNEGGIDKLFDNVDDVLPIKFDDNSHPTALAIQRRNTIAGENQPGFPWMINDNAAKNDVSGPSSSRRFSLVTSRNTGECVFLFHS